EGIRASLGGSLTPAASDGVVDERRGREAARRHRSESRLSDEPGDRHSIYPWVRRTTSRNRSPTQDGRGTIPQRATLHTRCHLPILRTCVLWSRQRTVYEPPEPADRCDLREELWQLHWFDQIVVRPCLQSSDLVSYRSAHRHDHQEGMAQRRRPM